MNAGVQRVLKKTYSWLLIKNMQYFCDIVEPEISYMYMCICTLKNTGMPKRNIFFV